MGSSGCWCFDVAYYFYFILISEFPTGGYPGGCGQVSKFFKVPLEQFSWETSFEGSLLVVDSEEVAGERFLVAVVEDVDKAVNAHGGVEGREADSQCSCWPEDHVSVGWITDMHGFEAPFQ